MGDPNGARYNPPLQADSTRQRFGLVRALTYPVARSARNESSVTRVPICSTVDRLRSRWRGIHASWPLRTHSAITSESSAGGIIHWPDLDEHLSSQGLLADAPAPDVRVTHGAG
jgi:hypothetical protein